MLTGLPTPEWVANHLLGLMSETTGLMEELLIILLCFEKDKAMTGLFWALLDKEYPGHSFKEFYYCDDCGFCEMR